MLTEKTAKDWEKYVLDQYPNEACAYVVDGKLFPVDNLSATPDVTFKVSAVDRIRAESLGKVEAFLHSHPYKLEQSPFLYDPSWATEADMTTWISDNIPWGIVATDGEGLSKLVWYDDSMEAIEPYDGREFVSGKNDCYSLVRDYLRKDMNILIPNYPRGMSWWLKGQNLYADNYTKEGFIEIPLSEVQVNDILLMRLVGDVISHSALVVETNRILHHCVGRLSGYDSLSKWSRQIVLAVRFQGK